MNPYFNSPMPAQTMGNTYSVFSDIEPICGMDYRSSGDVEILMAGNYTVSAPSGIQFDIYQNKGINEKIASYPLPANLGGTVYFQEEGKYFIAVKPNTTKKAFTVTFTGPQQMPW